MHEAAGGQAQRGTTVISDDVMLYHAVTLSATGRWKDARRPYAANNVTGEVAQLTCANDIQRVLAP